jgi:hypothetical protein
VVFLHRTTSSKARTVVPLARVCGRFDEAKALECLHEADLDVDKALELWAQRMASEAPPLRAWSSDEVRILNSAMVRFNDDFQTICPFLPGKTRADVASIFYTFPLFQKQGESVVHLFRLAEVHRPLPEGAARTDSRTDRIHQQAAGPGKAKGEGSAAAKRRKVQGQADGSAFHAARKGAKGRNGRGRKAAGRAWGEGGNAGSEEDDGADNDDDEREGDDDDDEEDEDDEGAEVGRVAAAQRFLTAAKGSMPDDKYARLVELLVLFDSESISMPKLLAEVMAILLAFPKLQKGFQPFLPPSWDMRGPNAV